MIRDKTDASRTILAVLNQVLGAKYEIFFTYDECFKVVEKLESYNRFICSGPIRLSNDEVFECDPSYLVCGEDFCDGPDQAEYDESYEYNNGWFSSGGKRDCKNALGYNPLSYYEMPPHPEQFYEMGYSNWPDPHKEIVEISEEEKMRGLLWYAYHELNAIRARDGAPEGVSHAYFDKLVETLKDTLGESESMPWPSEPAKKVSKKYLK